MDNRSIFERDYAGEPVSPNEPDYQLLIADIEDCMAKANLKANWYHSKKEVIVWQRS